MNVITKYCPKCGVEKYLCEFSPDRTRKLGVSSWCKECAAIRRANKSETLRINDPEYQLKIMMGAQGKKRCSICKEYKSLDRFAKDPSKPQGLRYECKDCFSKKAIERYNSNREEILQKNKEYRDINKDTINERRRSIYAENKEVINDKRRQDYSEDKLGILIKCAKYRENNRDKISQGMKKYYQENKDQIQKRVKEYWNTPEGRITIAKASIKRRNNMKLQAVTLTPDQWMLCLAEVDYKCPMCGKQFSDDLMPHVDHIYPLSLGGNLTYWNVQPLCKSCNSSKYNSRRVDHELRKAHTVALRLHALLT